MYAVTDRKWLNEVEKKRKDGYFEGHWWQDEERLYLTTIEVKICLLY